MLAEMSICIGDYDKAIAAAKRVIDGTDGDYHLMTERFEHGLVRQRTVMAILIALIGICSVWVILIIRRK